MNESYSDWREENNLEEMHGGTMSKLGPREKGRKDKGKKKPQAIRQAKARTKALKQKLNTEEIDVEEGFRHSQSQSRIDLYKKQTNRKSRKMYDSGYKVATGKGTPEDEKTHAKSKEQMGKMSAVDNYMRQIGKPGRKKGLPKTQGEKDAVAMAKKRMKPEDKKKQAAKNKNYEYDIMGEQKESYSDWRSDLVDLRELVVGNPPPAAMDKDIATNAKPKTSTKARQEVKENPAINNEVKINPTMRESFEALGGEILEVVDLTEERAKTREEARKKLEANRKAIEAGRPEDSPYGKHLKKKLKSPSEYGKDPWSTHPSDAKAHAKEETELDERSLTDGEKDEKEKYVKGMKKSIDGFKKRYGDRAKSVMYATATKMAKEGYDMDMAADVFIECGYEPEEFMPVLEGVIMGAE